MDDLDDEIPTRVLYDPWEQALHELLMEMDQRVDVIVVEGKRDREALRSAGIESPIKPCAHATTLDRCISELEGESIAILTDFDEHGKRLNGRFRDRLPDDRVEPRWRRELGLILTQRGRYDIESLNNIFDH